MTKPYVGGAPITKFTPLRVKRILADIKRGVPYAIAAEKNSIHATTFYKWRDQGLDDFLHNRSSEYAKLVESLREIEADRIVTQLTKIESNPRSDQGAEWVLERSFWRHFSSKATEIEVNERLERLEGIKHEKELDSGSNEEQGSTPSKVRRSRRRENSSQEDGKSSEID